MKITLLTIGSHGDVRPYVALGKGLKAHGYQVVIATHQEFEPFIKENGLDFHVVKGNPREVIESIGGQELLKTGTNVIQFLKKFKAAAHDSMLEGFDQCVQACQGADLIISPFLVSSVAYMIGKHLNIPVLFGYLQPVTPTSAFAIMTLPHLFLGGFLNRLSHQVGQQLTWNMFKDVLVEWESTSLKSGIRLPMRGFYRHMNNANYPVLYGISKTLMPRPADWPKWVQMTGFWLLETPQHTPSKELAAFLEKGDKPVYIGFGSMSNENPIATTELVLKALEKVQARGILLSGWNGLATQDLPEHVLALDKIPHDWLFPHCAAVVHHGGAGTTATGIKAGIPNVVVPFFGDQPFWAQRVFGMGYGPRPIPRQKLSADLLAKALDQALNSPRYLERTQKARENMLQENGVAKAVQLIDQYLARQVRK